MPKIRLPVAVPFTTRESPAAGGTYITDTALINCYIEPSKDKKKLYVVKRPGATTRYLYNGGAAAAGQGTFNYRGMNIAAALNTIFCLTTPLTVSAVGNAWTNTGNVPPFVGRFSFASAVFNGQMLIIGGTSGGGFNLFNDVWATTDGITWTQLTTAAPWGVRYNFSAVVFGTKLYIIGGTGNGVQYNDVWSTVDGVNWIQVTGQANFSTRSGFGCLVFNQTIVVMGGMHGAAPVSDIWTSSDGSTWVQVTVVAGWTARAQFMSYNFHGKVFLFGGINAAAATLQDCYSTSDLQTWTALGVNIPAPRQDCGYCIYGDAMWLFGGYNGAAAVATVYSTVNGVAFTVQSAAYGGPANYIGALIPFQTDNATSIINAPTMFWFAGATASNTFIATLNNTLAASTVLTTAAAASEQFYFAIANFGYYLVFKNSLDLFVFSEGVFKKASTYSTNYPRIATVGGIVELDGTVYVMDTTGVIYGCDLVNPLSWSANNYITADAFADTAVFLGKYRRYVVAFKSTSIQFFYDAGRYPGSPLLPIQDATSRVGCVTGLSVASLQDTLYFIARTEKLGHFAARLNGYQIEKISSPDVDRILNSVSCTGAFGYTFNGHPCYFIVLTNGTFIFDTTTEQWHVWTSTTGVGTPFPGINYFTDGTFDMLQDPVLGKIYSMSSTVFIDSSVNTIPVQIYLDKFDAGNNDRKFVGDTAIIGDRLSASSNLTIQWSDDDSQTFNTGIAVDLTAPRPHFPRGGSFRRRTYKLSTVSNAPLRLEAIELDIIGSK